MRIGPIQRAWKHSVGRWIGLQPFAVLLITFRPDFEPPWVGQPHATTLTINRLARREVEAMIDRVVGNKVLPTNIRQDIIERADGIPLVRGGDDKGGDGSREPKRGRPHGCGHSLPGGGGSGDLARLTY